MLNLTILGDLRHSVSTTRGLKLNVPRKLRLELFLASVKGYLFWHFKKNGWWWDDWWRMWRCWFLVLVLVLVCFVCFLVFFLFLLLLLLGLGREAFFFLGGWICRSLLLAGICVGEHVVVSTLPETNIWHLKRDGWNTSFLLGWPIFS